MAMLRCCAVLLGLGALLVSGCGLDSFGTDRVFVSAKRIAFGSALVGTRGLGQKLELVNLDRSALALGAMEVSGADASHFHVVNPCGERLAGRSQCAIEVYFSPEAEGEATATLSIASGVAKEPRVVTLTGSGGTQATADVIVYGATPAGVAAAVQAGRQGKTVLLLEASQHVGGMMANGLGATDFSAGYRERGLPREFFARVYATYKGNVAAQRESLSGHRLEPHVAESTFVEMLEDGKKISAALGFGLESVEKSGTVITGLRGRNGLEVRAKEFIDASYTGDVMAEAGVSYVVGRESRAAYGEDSAGVGELMQVGNRPVSAYVVPGVPGSGLLPHVSGEAVGEPGSGDDTVMAYNYRLCLSSEAANRIPFVAPAHYDAAEYELLGRLVEAANPKYGFHDLMNANPVPHHKFDLNGNRLLSTDEVGVSDGYPNGTVTDRARIEAEVKRYMEGYLYFLATDPRIPSDIQSRVKELGLCKDEFTDNGGWPHQIYVREARRMVGDFVLTQRTLESGTAVEDSIGVGFYPSDDHWHHLTALRGTVVQEGTRAGTPVPYRIPYRVMTPRASEATNLLVPVAVSASHWVYDSLRIEVTYMGMGQAAGAAAALAIDGGVAVQGVSSAALQGRLMGDGVVLTP